MNIRIFKKVVNTVCNAATKGDFESAYSRLQKVTPNSRRKILTSFNNKAFKTLGSEQGADVVMNFAAYRGLQQGLKQIGGTKGISDAICSSMHASLSNTMQEVSQRVTKELPQTTTGWTKLILHDKWVESKLFAKNIFCKVKNAAKKTKTKIKSKIPSTEKAAKTTSKPPIKKQGIVMKSIPDKYKPIFTNLEGKTGQEFVDTAYENMVNYMKLKGVAPKRFVIKSNDGVMTVTGGYDNISNTIEYSKGFLDKLTQEQQIGMIAHELKHCEQLTNMLRTEGIGVEKYAETIAENSVKSAINPSSFENFMFRRQYEKALQTGKGEEFIQKAIANEQKKIAAEIETNFAEVLKLPKIPAASSEGVKAGEHLRALRDYEGLNSFGFGNENYRNNPLEVEAYAYGDNIGELFKSFTA